MQRLQIDMMQKSRELGPARFPRRLVHPCKIRRQDVPALCPAFPLLARVLSRPRPSLRTPRFLRWFHRYYASVRHPVSARFEASVFPRLKPPGRQFRQAPTGLPGFRWTPFERDVVFDPGGLSVPRGLRRPTCCLRTVGIVSTPATLLEISWLISTPHSTAVYASNGMLPCRLQDSLLACPRALARQDFHLQDSNSFPSAPPHSRCTGSLIEEILDSL